MFLNYRQVSSFWVLRFRFLGASFSRFGCSVFDFWVLRFRVLGASFSRFGCFVLRSSFSSASFSKLPERVALFAAQTQSFLCSKFSTARLEVLPNLRHAGVFQMSTMVNLGIGFQFKSL